MTISSTTNRVSFAGNGVTVAFATSPVVFFDSADLTVYSVVTATGVSTLKTLTTDYTVTGGSGSTGTVTMLVAPATGTTLLIVRDVAITQGSDLVNNDSSDAEVQEDALDRLTMIAQQLDAKVERSFRLADSDVTGVDVELPDATTRALSVMGFDASGDFTLYDPSSAVTDSANVSFTASGTGAVATTVRDDLRNRDNSVTRYGASTSASAATNTTAFNAALAAHSVVFVPGSPGDVYDLNALTPWTNSKIFYGSATLRFNTTSNCVSLAPSTQNQRTRVRIEGLTFLNLTNVPASFIKNNGILNLHLSDLTFADCAATYCVDNVAGYGLHIDSCVFSDITGSAIRLKDNGSTEFSYIAVINNTDITRASVYGLDVQGAAGLNLFGTVIESCGTGMRTSSNSQNSYNLNLIGAHFESNTTQLSFATDGSTYAGYALLQGCIFNGGTIAMGSLGNLTLIGCKTSASTTISGSANAHAVLINSPGFVQSGSFNYDDQSGNSGSWCWGGTGTESLPLSVNAGTGGRTFFFLLSRQTNTGNFSASALYMVRCGYDGNNFTATKVSGDDGGIGAGASNFTFGQSSGVLTVTAAGGGNHIATWSANAIFKS